MIMNLTRYHYATGTITVVCEVPFLNYYSNIRPIYPFYFSFLVSKDLPHLTSSHSLNHIKSRDELGGSVLALYCSSIVLFDIVRIPIVE